MQVEATTTLARAEVVAVAVSESMHEQLKVSVK